MNSTCPVDILKGVMLPIKQHKENTQVKYLNIWLVRLGHLPPLSPDIVLFSCFSVCFFDPALSSVNTLFCKGFKLNKTLNYDRVSKQQKSQSNNQSGEEMSEVGGHAKQKNKQTNKTK